MTKLGFEFSNLKAFLYTQRHMIKRCLSIWSRGFRANSIHYIILINLCWSKNIQVTSTTLCPVYGPITPSAVNLLSRNYICLICYGHHSMPSGTLIFNTTYSFTTVKAETRDPTWLLYSNEIIGMFTISRNFHIKRVIWRKCWNFSIRICYIN